MPEEHDHAAAVDAWLRSASALPPEQLVELLEVTLQSLMASTRTTLGDVTLIAIVDRVLHNTAEAFPDFASLSVEPGQGVQAKELRARASSLPDGELRGGLRFVVVELLSVLGNLTAEILTPDLHAELARVRLPAPPEDTRP